MRYAIIDTCYKINKDGTQPHRGLGAQYVQWEMWRHGIQESNINDADVLLVSAVAPIEYKRVKALRKTYPDKKKIVGGPGASCPAIFEDYCDAICLGDGQRFYSELFENGHWASLPNIWTKGQTEEVCIDQEYPWSMPPLSTESGTYCVGLGRGCKNRCLFCHTTWAYKYQEHPDPERLLREIKRLQSQKRSFSYLSNDAMQHKFHDKLPSVPAGSYSIAYLKKTGLPPARTIRIGVEGVSARLRKAVGKPISREDLVGCTRWLNENGKSVRWFMIAGFPYEAVNDWSELKDTVMEWKRSTIKGTLGISFTAFIPEPSTPLCLLPISDDYYAHYKYFADWFFDGRGWSNRISLMQPKSPESRNESIAAHMGKDISQVYDVNAPTKNSLVQYQFADLKKIFAQKYKDTMEVS